MNARWRFHLVYFASWLPFAALYAFIVAQRATLLDAAMSGLLSAASAAVLGLVARASAGRIRRVARRRWQFLLAHALQGAIYSAVWTAIISAMVYWGAPPQAWRSYVENGIGWQYVTGLALYGLVSGVFEAVDAIARLREQERLAARAEALRSRAELQALRAQLNPHFLFNTLHSITALVRSDPPAAELALERFGMLMRRVLEINREQRDEIPLAEELEFVRAYLQLEAMRHGDRLRLVEEIDPDTLECYVLAFSLQPLVENAVVHGIAPLPRGGTIRVAAELGDEALVLEVADDGVGADFGRVNASDGLGVRAVRQRLAARFGRAAKLDVATAPGEGCRVRLTMPVVVRPLRAGATAEYALPR
jgi:signal transduction histidine kinase